MALSNQYIVPYTGDALKTNKEVPLQYLKMDANGQLTAHQILEEDGKTPKKEVIAPYLPDDTLKEAIELMQVLERPLLLRGEPGCGKTKVAQAYAYERYGDDYRQFYFEWHVKSTSKAQDGLYTFDHIARLRNANARKADETTEEITEEMTKYREFGPLGRAFKASKPGQPAILLIDEIDKADIDFPNDLLLELDEMRFTIKETQEEITPEQRPIIIITSNQERELPQAFLRRCLFHFILFPEHLLQEIMLANFPDLNDKGRGQQLAADAIQRFLDLRTELKNNPAANKNVSTSELKDWMKILDYYFTNNPDNPQLQFTDGKLPFHTALLKTENDLKSLKKMA